MTTAIRFWRQGAPVHQQSQISAHVIDGTRFSCADFDRTEFEATGIAFYLRSRGNAADMSLFGGVQLKDGIKFRIVDRFTGEERLAAPFAATLRQAGDIPTIVEATAETLHAFWPGTLTLSNREDLVMIVDDDLTGLVYAEVRCLANIAGARSSRFPIVLTEDISDGSGGGGGGGVLIDSLTSTSTTAGLTAAQGKVLKDLLDAAPDWPTLTPADNATTIEPGRYLTDASAAFGVTLAHDPGEEWHLSGLGLEGTNNVAIGTAGDTFRYFDAATGLVASSAGPFVIDTTKEVRIIAETAASTYRIVAETGGVGGLAMQPEQSADFTAEAGKEYPVDVSALGAGGLVTVTSPTGTPTAGDSFAVFDSRLATDNGIDPPGLNRRVRISFATDPVHSLPAPDFAEINSAGARIQFVYTDATVGWRIASNVNA